MEEIYMTKFSSAMGQEDPLASQKICNFVFLGFFPIPICFPSDSRF